MLIWAIALLLAACSAVAGFCFGVIRAAVTFIGLFVSLLVARIFAHTVTPMFSHVGIKDPIVAWMLSPVVVFLLALTVVKVIGVILQRKVNLYYKYKAGDLRMGLWARLNTRLGLCLGFFNALVYMVLIVMIISIFSQATVQLSSPDSATWTVRLLNEAGHELESTGMARVAAAVDPMPANYYKAVDLAGLLYHNDLLEARLSRYPAFLTMAQRQEFQDIATDKDFAELRQRQPPISDILNHPRLKAILDNPEELGEIWQILVDNFDDLMVFLKTGQSPKYADQKLVGWWDFNMNATLTSFQEQKPDATTREMFMARQQLTLMFGKTTLLATLDNQAFLKNFGVIKYPSAAPAGGRGGRGGRGGAAAEPPQAATPTVDVQPTVQGRWSENATGDGYKFNFSTGNYEGTVDADTLILTGSALPLTFDREY
jgi:Colicin V production protein